MFTGLGRLAVNKFLSFPRGANRSFYIAFFLSGLIHFSGDFMLEKRFTYRSFKFFLLQVIIITFEDLVIYIAKGLLRQRGIEFKPGKAWECWREAVVRVIGYYWVTPWFCLALPVWIDEPNTQVE